MTQPRDSRLDAMLAAPRYEVIPLPGAEERVLASVPRDVTVTVTVSPSKGLDVTFALVDRLAGHGYAVVPHLSARLVRSRGHLAELVARAGEAGIRDVFVIAGDAAEAQGPYEGAAALLTDLTELGHPFQQLGIAGYPQSHPLIDDATTINAMFEKAAHATYIVSQLCFDPRVTAQWVSNVWDRGTQLPIWLGVPGVVSPAKLLRISTQIGIRDSMRFGKRYAGKLVRTIRPGAYKPDKLIRRLEQELAGRAPAVVGLHLFTFNELEATEAWRHAGLARSGVAAAGSHA